MKSSSSSKKKQNNKYNQYNYEFNTFQNISNENSKISNTGSQTAIAAASTGGSDVDTLDAGQENDPAAEYNSGFMSYRFNKNKLNATCESTDSSRPTTESTVFYCLNDYCDKCHLYMKL